MLIQDVEVFCLAVSISKTVTTMLRHSDQDEREFDGSRHLWVNQIRIGEKVCISRSTRFQWRSVVTKDFEGSTKKRIEYCINNIGFFVSYELFKGILVVFHSKPKLIGYVLILRNWKRYTLSWNFQSVLGDWLNPRGKEKDKARQAVFLTPTNPFGNDPEEEEPHDDYTGPQKVPYATRWKPDQDAVYWIRLSKAQDQGLKFWQTRSFAIMTHAVIPGDCLDHVTSQNGDRVNFKRLETPRPPPEVTLKSCWQTQQQHSTFGTDVPGPWKRGAKREDQAGAQDVTDHSTEAELAPGNWCIKRRTWMRVLFSATKKSGRMHSYRAKVWNKKWKRRIQSRLKESKLVQTIFVFTKTWRRRTWCLAKNLAKLSSRWVSWSSLKWRHPELNAQHVYSLFLKWNNHLRMWLAYQTRPGGDTTYQNSFWNSQSTLFLFLFPYFKRLQTRTQLVVGTPPQGKRRTARYEKEQHYLYIDLG